jgi:pSer/pThr/pTyr-binding forkhead associated (FHA) protein
MNDTRSRYCDVHAAVCERPYDVVAPLGLLVLPEERRVEVAKPSAVIGRHSEAELRLPYADVSRRHCRLEFADGQWHVCDLDSLNGLFVNGVRMHEATLSEGDCIRIGEATLVVTDAPALGPGAEVLRSIGAVLTGS